MLHPYLIVLLTCTVVSCVIRLEKGAYKQVHIVFDEGVTVDWNQKQILEKLIRHASHDMYVATNGMAYFGEVIIMVEKHSKNFSEDVKNWPWGRDFFSDADIRIVRPTWEHGSDLYTLQTGECGEKGKFIRLTPSFYENLTSNDSVKYAARRLLKEWIRFRYGVFDEQESFRWEGKQISPATCVDGIRGWAMTEALDRCTLDCGRVRSDCRFFPDLKNNSGVESSLMSLPELPDVKHFCNSSNHNKRAPSMHNKMCNSRSITDVILDHEDFKHAHQWLHETTKPVPQTNILWRLLPERSACFMFVVESSHKMEEEFSTQMLQQFLERFFEHLAPRDSWFAFVKFSNEAEVIQGEFKEVSDGNNDDIERVAKAVGSPSATPDIGSALLKAHYIASLSAATWLLISTGDVKIEEYDYERVTARYLEGEDFFRMVHSFAVGRHPSWKLDRLSRMTDGDSYFLGDKNSSREPHSFDVDMAFLALMHSVVEERLRPVVIKYERITLKKQGDWIRYSFQMDDGIGKDLVVTLSRNDTGAGFDGTTIGGVDWHRRHDTLDYTLDYNMEEREYGFGSTAMSLHKGDAKHGEWKIKIYRPSNEEEMHVDVLVTAKPRVGLKGGWIWMRAWITNVTEDKKGKGTKGYHRIYAEVKKGSNPVIHAKVIATVEIPGQNDPIEVTLKDNGAAPDVFKDDGIYSSFFPVTERPAGRPIVIVRVSDNDGMAKLKTAECKRSRSPHTMLKDYERQRVKKKFGPSKRWFSQEDFVTYLTTSSPCNETNEVVQFCLFPLEIFTRAAMANSPILFEMSKSDVQQTPPAAIRDLKVLNEFVRGGEFFALLQWTSPEHPRHENSKVYRIEIRGSRNREDMIPENFAHMESIFIERNPLPAGEIEQLEVEIPPFVVKDMKDEGTIHNVFLAMRAQDELGNKGEMSNVAEAFFERLDAVDTLQRLKAAKGKSAGGQSWVPWTGGVIGFLVVAGIAAFGIRKWKQSVQQKGVASIKWTRDS